MARSHYPVTMSREPSLLYQVKQVELAVRAQLDDVVRPFGLTTTQYTAVADGSAETTWRRWIEARTTI